MEALTITFRQKVKDHLISNKIILHEFKVPSTLLQYAQSARHKYEVYLETSRSEKEQDRKSKQIEVCCIYVLVFQKAFVTHAILQDLSS